MDGLIEKLEWSEKIMIHDHSIDNDHKKIFNLINEIIEMEELYPRSENLAIILSQLSDYGLRHFKKEEKLMERLGYPNIEKHRKSHLEYIYKVSMFNLNFKEANCTEPAAVIKFIRDWWYSHILKMDMHLKNYIKAEPGMSDAEKRIK